MSDSVSPVFHAYSFVSCCNEERSSKASDLMAVPYKLSCLNSFSFFNSSRLEPVTPVNERLSFLNFLNCRMFFGFYSLSGIFSSLGETIWSFTVKSFLGFLLLNWELRKILRLKQENFLPVGKQTCNYYS